ncbi:MAG: ATP synthase F1 subunit gamma [Bacteroidota bacterium]
MANLKEVRIRIASIKSTRQITSAMKMVSASKLRKGQTAIQNLRPYEEQLRLTLNKINNVLSEKDKNSLCIQHPSPKNVLFIVITANKGLCGTFNSHLLKASLKHIHKLGQQGLDVELLVIGKKAQDFFRKTSYKVFEVHNELIDKVTVEDAFAMARKAMNLINEKRFHKIDLIYNRFRNAAVYEIISEQFLPLVLPEQVLEEEEAPEVEYIMEPSRKELMDELVPKSIQTYFYRVLLDSYASEQGARMTAMHKATDNATELLKNLTIAYNKARQTSITNEIVEIVGGAEALDA